MNSLQQPLNPIKFVVPEPVLEPVSPRKITRPARDVGDMEAISQSRLRESTKHSENVRKTDVYRWAVLILTAIMSGTLSFSIDQFTQAFGNWRTVLTNNNGSLLLVTVVNVLAVVLARLINRTTIESEGSGFPEMKAMLFGKVMLNFLTLRALACKAFSLALGVGAGLPLGKEGPNVHMAACISRALAPEFYEKAEGQGKHLRNARVTYLLLAACAVAVGASFAAPIGGVIFALELMLPQIYDTVAYWGCFVSSVAGALVYLVLRTATSGATTLQPLMTTNILPGEGVTSARPVTRLLCDLLLGCICGLLGGLWIQAHAKVGGIMKRWRAAGGSCLPTEAPQAELPDSPRRKGALATMLSSSSGPAATPPAWWNGCFMWRDMFQVVVVVTLNTWLSAQLPLLHGKPQPMLMSTLFDKNLDSNEDGWVLEWAGPLGTLILCFLMKASMTIFALCLPLSAGMVAPVMVIGGLVGRIYGLMLPDFLVDFLLSSPDGTLKATDVERGALMARFAIVGAAAHATAVSRAFAMAITVYEVLTLPSSLLPLCTSCLAAIFVANKISIPFFDMNLTGRGLGGISALTQTDYANKSATCVMRFVDSDSECLHEIATLQEIRDVLASASTDPDHHFPILENCQSRCSGDGVVSILKGSVTRKSLENILSSQGKAKKDIRLTGAEFIVPTVESKAPPVVVNPYVVTPDAMVKDVFIMMKATEAEAVFVVEDNVLMGVIGYKELLGHRLDKPWFG